MTEKELRYITMSHPTAVSIWLDRMHETSTVVLTDLVVNFMPAEELLDAVGKIKHEQEEERKYDN
jgi:hypothetical protein